MTPHPIRPRPRRAAAVVAVLVAALVGIASVASATGRSTDADPKPTIVLVHGAFADASGWNDVTERLQRRGYTVLAPANPLRGLAGDSAYLASLLDAIEGPVVLVGHSYGGAVMTNAATGRTSVVALVYVAAFAPDEGDTVETLSALYPGSRLGPDALVVWPTPGGLDGSIRPDLFRAVFAADLPRRQAAVMGASQRPASLATLTDVSGPPAWATIPSWYLVARDDQVIPAATQRFMAERAGAHVVELSASHVVMTSRPAETAALVVHAARATR